MPGPALPVVRLLDLLGAESRDWGGRRWGGGLAVGALGRPKVGMANVGVN